MHSITAIVIVSVVVASAYSREVPSFIKPCKHDDPKINECVSKIIEDLKPRLAAGIPELFIPSMEPLLVPIAKIDQDDFRADFTDLEIYHVPEFKIISVDIKPDENYFKLEIEFPNLRIKSHYNISGELLLLKLNGEGPSDGNFTNVKAVATIKGERIKKEDKEYIDFNNNKLELEIEGGHIELEKLFKEKEDLTAAGNELINQNIKELISDIKPIIIETIEKLVFDVVKKAFFNFSVDEVFEY